MPPQACTRGPRDGKMPAPLPEALLPLTQTHHRGRWSASWFMTMLTLLAVLCFVRLGFWQWHRAQEKRATATSFEAGNATVTDLGARATGSLPRYTQVRLQGRYDDAHQFLLENMSQGGQPGYQVLTPLLLADGRTLLVNRGWVPLSASRRDPPKVALDQVVGEVSPAGKLDALPVPGIALGHLAPDDNAPWPRLTSFPTMTDLSAALKRPLEARQLLLNADEPLGYVRDWHPTGLGPERHIAYAVQWWGFALLAVGLYARLNWHRATGMAR
jgi:surfeit locus 1 family protein